MRAVLRWLGRTAGSSLTALLLVGVGFYLHFLWAGPELMPWHRVRLTGEFTASDYDVRARQDTRAIPRARAAASGPSPD